MIDQAILARSKALDDELRSLRAQLRGLPLTAEDFQNAHISAFSLEQYLIENVNAHLDIVEALRDIAAARDPQAKIDAAVGRVRGLLNAQMAVMIDVYRMLVQEHTPSGEG